MWEMWRGCYWRVRYCLLKLGPLDIFRCVLSLEIVAVSVWFSTTHQSTQTAGSKLNPSNKSKLTNPTQIHQPNQTIEGNIHRSQPSCSRKDLHLSRNALGAQGSSHRSNEKSHAPDVPQSDQRPTNRHVFRVAEANTLALICFWDVFEMFWRTPKKYIFDKHVETLPLVWHLWRSSVSQAARCLGLGSGFAEGPWSLLGMALLKRKWHGRCGLARAGCCHEKDAWGWGWEAVDEEFFFC